MGNRTEGKTKKKSIKANVTSKFNSKRKASRMGKKVKEGTMGPNTEFVTRSAALKKLQITLKDFRRLCILKGVYPRVPTKGLKGNDKVYYDIKEISHIMHEPLLKKFRDFKSFMKKIRKAAGRSQFDEARRKDELKPQITLDHLVKERYPRFIDALRDLDDALCMVHLFASMPSAGRVTADRTRNCCQLVRQWQYYISKSRTLSKVFVSVKGVYFQAEVMGEPITWLAPHQFTQTVPKEVDTRVMLTFLEFYEVFLQFVLFKLYSSQGLCYPPKVDKHLDQEGCLLMALKSDRLPTEGDQQEEEVVEAEPEVKKATKSAKHATSAAAIAALPKLLNEMDGDEDEEDEELGLLAAPLEQALGGLGGVVEEDEEDEIERKVFASQSDAPLKRLFSSYVFFFNREVPLEWMQLCTVSFGAKVGWDGPQSPYSATDPRVTHHVVDRPQQGVSLQREYVQPQWIFDCINAGVALPAHAYRPGAKLPPHLSPFVDDEKEGYVPRYREEIQKLQNVSKGLPAAEEEAVEVVEEEEEEEDEEAAEAAGATRANKRKAKETPKAGKKQKQAKAQAEEEEAEEEEVDEQAGTAGRRGPKGIVHAPEIQAVTEVSHASPHTVSVPVYPSCSVPYPYTVA